MKCIRGLLMFLIIFAVLTGSLYSVSASDSSEKISINLNGKRIEPDVPPFISNNRTMAPLSGVFQGLGARVEWVSVERKVVVTYKDKKVVVHIGKKTAYVNGVAKQMEVAPVIVQSRTMIPLSFISEHIGMWVRWVPEARLVTVTEPAYFNSTGGINILGYTTHDYRGDNKPHESLLANYASLDTIATFSYRFFANGGLELTGESQESSAAFARSKGIRPLLLVHNFLNREFDKELAHTVLADSSKRKLLIDNILIAMSKEGYAGVNIDIENVYWHDRKNYTAFIKELKEKLAPYGYLTTASIPAKTQDTYTNNNWSGAFDYAEIGKHADRVMLMTYDEHYFGGSPGAVASYPWVKKVLDYAVEKIPSAKLYLGIPGYGYDWADSGSRAVPFRDAEALRAKYNAPLQWDSTMKAPWFVYTVNGIKHTVWYENSASLGYKLDMVKPYKLAGIAIWKLGYDDAAFWKIVNTKLN
jgi:spore germination protein YaaH